MHEHLAMLHVTSNDPRRAGQQDIAIFEKDLVPLLEVFTWNIRGGFVVNNRNNTLLSVIAEVRGLGTMQRESNCDYTVDNLCKRPAPKVCGLDNLKLLEQSNPNWRLDSWKKKYAVDNFAPMKYRSRSEWTELTIPVDEVVSVKIKINKWLVKYIPKRLCYRPLRKVSQLFLLPNKEQRKRRKYDDDHRHGMSLGNHILACMECFNVRSTRLKDRFDFRVDDSGDFIGSTNVKNIWHNTEMGLVLEVILPEGHCHSVWDGIEVGPHIYPNVAAIDRYLERKAYYLVSETVADKAQDYNWTVVDSEATCIHKEETSHLGKAFRLKKLVCELSGVAVSNISIASRMSKYYEKAIEDTSDRGRRARAKFENALPSEKTTSNKMYVDSKFIHFKKIHCTKHIHIPELNVTALDMRIESIRVGGNNE